MAKPFALPDPPGQDGGGASTSGAGPPAGAGPINGHPGYQGPGHPQQHQQPPQSAPPVVSHGSAGAFPLVGPAGHVPSTPIPVTGANGHYYHHHHYGHHLPPPPPPGPQPTPLFHPNSPPTAPHYYYPGHYQGGPAYGHHAVIGGSAPSSGSNAPEGGPLGPRPLPPPPNSAFAHTPHQGAANDELVQALYEALHRCGVRGTNCISCSENWWTNTRLRESPPTPLSHTPPSASCSPPPTTVALCAPPQTFFPRTPASAPPVGPPGGRPFFHPAAGRAPSQPTPLSATSHSSSSGVSSSVDTPSCSSGTPHYVQSRAQPVLFNWQDDGDSSESDSTSASQATSSSGCSPSCFGLDESESSTAGASSPEAAAVTAGPVGVGGGTALVAVGASGVTAQAGLPLNLDTYLARREQLQEFPGKIPQRKRRSRTPKPKKSRFLEKPLMWHMAVTAALIALGCGYFTGR